MNYPLYIEASEETLRMLDEKFKPVAEDRFIYSLQQKHWTIEEIHNFNARLQISYTYTLKEYERMQELCKTYNGAKRDGSFVITKEPSLFYISKPDTKKRKPLTDFRFSILIFGEQINDLSP